MRKSKIKQRAKSPKASSNRTGRPAKPTHEVSPLLQHILDGWEEDAKISRKDNNRRKNQQSTARRNCRPSHEKSLRRFLSLSLSISQQLGLLTQEILKCLISLGAGGKTKYSNGPKNDNPKEATTGNSHGLDFALLY
jgi:hypothetical protein